MKKRNIFKASLIIIFTVLICYILVTKLSVKLRVDTVDGQGQQTSYGVDVINFDAPIGLKATSVNGRAVSGNSCRLQFSENPENPVNGKESLFISKDAGNTWKDILSSEEQIYNYSNSDRYHITQAYKWGTAPFDLNIYSLTSGTLRFSRDGICKVNFTAIGEANASNLYTCIGSFIIINNNNASSCFTNVPPKAIFGNVTPTFMTISQQCVYKVNANTDYVFKIVPFANTVDEKSNVWVNNCNLMWQNFTIHYIPLTNLNKYEIR